MTNEDNQECSQCRNFNPAEALICELCGSGLAKEGMMFTYHPRSIINSNGNDKTLAPQQSSMAEDSVLLDVTISPEPAASYNKPESIEKDGMAQFKINQVLGEGGMGAVYRAQDLTLHRFVAIKLFRSKLAETQSNGQQLLDEARMACQLNHPNIVTIYDIARGQGSNYIVMEWVDGQPLDKLISENGLAVETALEYACQIIDGLVCAHQNGIIHRDIKPQNIMLNKDGRIKILDFGIADLLRQSGKSSAEKQFDELSMDDGNITRISGIVGTPQYMAPEQALGQAVDQRADIFAFGVVFYEMLTGQRPFKGENINQLKKALNKGDYPPLNQLQPDLPEALITLVDKMLTTDVSLRWQTSTDLAEAIHQLYNQLTRQKNWWQRRHWLSKAAIVIPFVLMLGWSFKEIIFPPTTQELVDRQLVGATKIAILPFDNISGDPLLQIFNDGLVTTLSSDLSKAGQEQGDGTTWVIPSSEIRRMKEVTVKSVSDKYGVDLILTGSIQHMGSTRLLVLTLLNAKDGRQLKTTELNIDAKELFQGQQDVRKQVLTLLGWKISDKLLAQYNKERPQFDGAYKEYIEGKGYLYRDDQQGNLEKALDSFSRAIEIDSNYQLAYVGLAEGQHRLFTESKEQQWLRSMEQTIIELQEINPRHVKLDYLSAEIFFEQGKYGRAVELLEKSIKNNLYHIESFLALAYAYEKLNEFEKTEAIYEEVKRISPNNTLGIAYFGVYYFSKGDYAKAIEQFEEQIRIAPNSHWAFLNMAASYYTLGQIDEAIKYTEIAIKLNPSADSFSNLGTMYFYEAQYHKAVRAYEKMIALNSTDYINWGNLADAYHYSNSDKKIMAYQRATELAQQALDLNSRDTMAIAHNAYYLANLNDRKNSMYYAQQIGEQQTGIENFVAATAYSLLSEIDLSFKHINYAIVKNYPLEEIQQSPLLDNIKKDKRFLLLREID